MRIVTPESRNGSIDDASPTFRRDCRFLNEKRRWAISLLFLLILPLTLVAQEYSMQELKDMTLEELLSVTVSTPAKHNQKLWESTSQMTVVTREEIEAWGYTDLVELFQAIVGSLISDEGNRNIIALRSMPDPSTNNSRFLFLINGHVMNDNYFQRSFPSERMGINLKNISRVEIVRGPGSVLYGSSAFQGIINLVIDRPESSGIDAAISTGGMVGSAGGLDPGEKQSLLNSYEATLRIDKIFSSNSDLYLSGSLYNNNGQWLSIPFFNGTDSSGVVKNVDFHQTASTTAKYHLKNLTALVGYNHAKDGLPLADYGADPGSLKNRTEQNLCFADLLWDQKLSDTWSGFARFFGDYNAFDGFWQYGSALDHQKVISEKAGLEIQTQYTRRRNLFLAGIEAQTMYARQDEIYPSESYSGSDEYSFSNLGLYVQDEYHLSERWIASAAGRLEISRELGPLFLGRASVIYTSRKNFLLKLNYAEGFKNPLLHDYYYHSSILNLRNYEIADLEPERARNLELVYDYKKGAMQLEVCAFYNQKLKLIALDNTYDYYRNSESMNGYGTEFSGSYNLGAKQKFYFNGILQDNKWVKSTTPFYNTPHYSIKGGVLAMLLPMEQLGIALEFQQYGFADYLDSPKRLWVDFKQKPYLLVNTNLFVKNIIPQVQLSLKINNLLNTHYFYPLAKGVAQPFPGNGFNFRLSLRYVITGQPTS